MFGLFKNKNNDFAVKVATSASIQPVLDAGKIQAFLILVDGDGESLAPHFKSQNAVQAFVDAIEARIKTKDFDDGDADGVSKMTTSGDVRRVVASNKNTKLFEWVL